MKEDDVRLGRVIRLIRHQACTTQAQLASSANVPLADLKLVEAGRASAVKLGRIRAILEALDGRAKLVPWWKGAAADRLLDERHAAIAERCAGYFPRPSWATHLEVSFAEYGERGSIDILGANRAALAVA
ncbi:MAG TPA: hypothetical protein VIF08_04670, partial [Candidatus Limnocylindrales bacterium]